MNVLLLDYQSAYNQGDAARVEVVKSLLKAVDPGVRIVLSSEMPKLASAVHGVESIPEPVQRNWGSALRWMMAATLWILARHLRIPPTWLGASLAQAAYLQSLQQADVVISVSGYALSSNAVVTVSRLFNYWQAKCCGKKVALIAQTIFPTNRWLLSRMVRWVLARLDVVTVRDSGSLRFLGADGRGMRVQLTADLAWLLDRHGPAASQNVHESADRPFVVLCPRATGAGAKRDDAYLRSMAQLADFLVSVLGYQVKFLSTFVLGDAGETEGRTILRENDQAFAERVLAHCTYRGAMELIRKNVTLTETLGILRGARFVISSRMHLTIFAMTLGIPAIGIVGFASQWFPEREKWAGAFTDLGLGSFLVQWDAATPRQLELLAQWISDRHGDIAGMVADRVDWVQERAGRNEAVLAMLLG